MAGVVEVAGFEVVFRAGEGGVEEVAAFLFAEGGEEGLDFLGEFEPGGGEGVAAGEPFVGGEVLFLLVAVGVNKDFVFVAVVEAAAEGEDVVNLEVVVAECVEDFIRRGKFLAAVNAEAALFEVEFVGEQFGVGDLIGG